MDRKWALIRNLKLAMHFDDSLFEQEDKAGSKRLEASKIEYSAKRCELNWFNQIPEVPVDALSENTPNTEGSFMLLKYRADLLYYKKEYRQSAVQYQAVLKEVPVSNSVVHREVTDSLARCWLHVGEFQKALEKGQMLVQSPHENDWNAWKLISVCQKSTNNIKGHVLSLQKCTSLQRYQPNYWTCLAEGYKTLGQICKSNPTFENSIPEKNFTEGNSFVNHFASRRSVVDQSSLVSILENTIALLRPYFSWRSLPKFNGPDRDVTTVTTDCNHRGDTCTSLGEKLSGLDIEPPSTDGLSCCNRYCIFNSLFGRIHHGSYLDVILTVNSQPLCENFEPSSPSLCLIHSPFAVLMSGQVSVTDFSSLLENLSSSLTNVKFSRDILCSFFFMSECSCLLWTRQLLMYFGRYSHSFVKDAREVELGRVEQLLDSCHGDTRHFLEIFFNKKRVFDESQAS